LSSLEQRLFQQASQGSDELRDFIYIRRGIYLLDMTDVQTWAEGVRASQSACLAAARAKDETTVATSGRR